MEKRICAAVYADNELVSLAEMPEGSPGAAPVYLDSEEGRRLVRRTLAFTLCLAADRALPGRFLIIGQPAAEDCPYWTFADGVLPSQADLDTLEAAMRSLVERNLDIGVAEMPVGEAARVFEARRQMELVRHTANCGKARLKVCRCEGFADIYRAPLLDKTGKLPPFSLKAYHKGFLVVPETVNKALFDGPPPPLFEMHDQYTSWIRICGASSAAALSALTSGASRSARDFIHLSEMYAEQHFSRVAQKVYQRRKEARIILLAGPSSSGKTTAAKRLCLHLRLAGLKPVILSLDDYYLPPGQAPRDAEGKPDLECPEALDIPYLNGQLLSLLEGGTVMMPKFDFKTGTRRDGEPLCLERRSVLVVEGIHALNDALTRETPPGKKFKVYVSALTQITLDEHHRIASSDNRLLRRIVRDSQFRAMPAARTLAMWPSVRRGELRHIFPFQNTAACIINSALEYELGVLRLYADPLLRAVPVSDPSHAEAARLLALLENVACISPQYVPGTSILREFIGGSDFKY